MPPFRDPPASVWLPLGTQQSPEGDTDFRPAKPPVEPWDLPPLTIPEEGVEPKRAPVTTQISDSQAQVDESWAAVAFPPRSGQGPD